MQTLNPYKYNANESVFRSTQEERTNRQNSGMNELTVDELKETLLHMGFKISESDSLKYINNYNKVTYKAKSCYIIDIKTKLSFANVDFYQAHPERLAEIQKFRHITYAYCMKTHTIYDL